MIELRENAPIAERMVCDIHGNLVVVHDYPREDFIRGRALRCLRRDAGLTMADLARALGLRVMQVAGVEHGRYVPVHESEWRAAIMRHGDTRR